MKFLFFLFLICQSSVLHAKEFKGLGLGVKGGLLYGCLSGWGGAVWAPLGKYFTWETAFINSQSDKTSSLQSSDETGANDIEDDVDTSNIDVIEASVRRSMAHTQFRYFPRGGSFNLALGAALARVSAKYEAESTISDDYANDQYTIDYSAWSFSIGNVWSWRHFYIAMDWVGFMRPMGHSVKKESESSENQSVEMTQYADAFEESALFCPRNGGSILILTSFGIIL